MTVMPLDPINRADYNPLIGRPANPERMEQLSRLAEQWRAAQDIAQDARNLLDDAIAEARETGHSFPQLRKHTGFSVSTIQAILVKKNVR